MKKCKFYCFPLLGIFLLKIFSSNSNNTYKIQLDKLFDAIVKGDLKVTKLVMASLRSDVTFYWRHTEKYRKLNNKIDNKSYNFVNDMPIHLAALLGHLHIVKYLIKEKNTDVNIKSASDSTPLYYACRGGRVNVVKYLLKKGAKVDESCSGGTALHMASKKGYLEIVKILLKAGAKIDALDCCSKTALDCACEEEKFDVAKCLVKQGGTIDRCYVSRIIDNPDIERVKFFVEHGGKIGLLRSLAFQLEEEPIIDFLKIFYYFINVKYFDKSKKKLQFFVTKILKNKKIVEKEIEDLIFAYSIRNDFPPDFNEHDKIIDLKKNLKSFLKKSLDEKFLDNMRKYLVFMVLRRTLHLLHEKEYCNLCIGLWDKMCSCKKLNNIVCRVFDIDKKNAFKGYHDFVLKEMEACNFDVKKRETIAKSLICNRDKKRLKKNLYKSKQKRNYSDIAINFGRP